MGRRVGCGVGRTVCGLSGSEGCWGLWPRKRGLLLAFLLDSDGRWGCGTFPSVASAVAPWRWPGVGVLWSLRATPAPHVVTGQWVRVPGSLPSLLACGRLMQLGLTHTAWVPRPSLQGFVASHGTKSWRDGSDWRAHGYSIRFGPHTQNGPACVPGSAHRPQAQPSHHQPSQAVRAGPVSRNSSSELGPHHPRAGEPWASCISEGLT